MKIAVVGQGYVGLPLTKAAVEAGHDVVGYDVDKKKVGLLADGKTPIDDVTDGEVQWMLATGRYKPTIAPGDLENFDAAIITVPTPLSENGDPNLTYIEAAGHDLAMFLRKDAIVVLESTSYPGTTEEVLRPVLESGSGLTAGRDFALGFSPERIDPGNELWDFKNTPKLVSGLTEICASRVMDLYKTLTQFVIPVRSIKAAELAKVWENTFRHVNIALANEMAGFAHEMGIDVWEAISAASTKPFGFMPFRPGPGVGGHCLPIDPAYLAWRAEKEVGRPFRFVQLAQDVNGHQPEYVATRIVKLLNSNGVMPSKASVVVLGMAYKKNSSDCRETPTEGLVKALKDWDVHVMLHDPHAADDAPTWGCDRLLGTVDQLVETPSMYDLIVLVTDHDEYMVPALGATKAQVFDTRGVMPETPNVTRL